MGRRIIPKAIGKGGPKHRVQSHRYAGKVEYNLSFLSKNPRRTGYSLELKLGDFEDYSVGSEETLTIWASFASLFEWKLSSTMVAYLH
jgi:hypothetical protein